MASVSTALVRDGGPLSVVAPSVIGMRDLGGEACSGSAVVLPSLAAMSAMTQGLGGVAEPMDDADRIDRIRALEELKCAAEGAQAELSAAFDASQREAAARA